MNCIKQSLFPILPLSLFLSSLALRYNLLLLQSFFINLFSQATIWYMKKKQFAGSSLSFPSNPRKKKSVPSRKVPQQKKKEVQYGSFPTNLCLLLISQPISNLLHKLNSISIQYSCPLFRNLCFRLSLISCLCRRYGFVFSKSLFLISALCSICCHWVHGISLQNL